MARISLLQKAAAIGLIGLSSLVMAQSELTLEQAVSLALGNDPWLDGSRYRERALTAQSIAAESLPDPMVSVGFENLPADGFNFRQEPMTQFRVGVSQVFPRSETRDLKRRQLSEEGAQQPLMRQDRLARVTVAVSRLWLETYRNRWARELIEEDRALFEYLVDVAESSYTSAVGETRRQDLVRAQLELIRLEDRLMELQQQQEMNLAGLHEWLPGANMNDIELSRSLPELTVGQSLTVGQDQDRSERLLQLLLAHPRIRSIDQEIVATGTGIRLAEQKYKPQWSVNASYGYREDDPMGVYRSDFVSFGVSFDLPIFTTNRQDREVQAAQDTEAAARTEKTLELRSMLAGLEAALARLERLSQRETLYEERLLQEISDQAEASLTAYTNEAGDFAEVVRARIAELNTNIEFLNIQIDRLQTIAELNYYLVPVEEDNIRSVSP